MGKSILIAARDNAIQEMNYFHEDKKMYAFWRSVYRHYQSKVAAMRRAAFLACNKEQ